MSEAGDALLVVHAAMKEKGLLSGRNDDYWYSVWDGLVAELAPELAEG